MQYYCIYKRVSTHPKRPTRPTMKEQKMKDEMPTLLQNQKSCIPTLKANAMQHICFCPNATASRTILYTFEN